ncbi:MAG: quinone-dependent dihydroorotate dehydrogenase [Bdellovibrionaceae bacterium]|nr:quinone-dependent dihydroorotate dehydrogenase [Pseudobdellovibrionaceae bacterium]MDW8190465.1 quinone-dependent dihydroorotate dehydrogenase [Pseudobdellovibrionaceae bacterium]
MKVRFWRYLPPEFSHRWAPAALAIYRRLWAPLYEDCLWNPISWGKDFYRNPLGIAGGFDKNAQMVDDLFRIGFGFVEVGTVTPLPQGPNPGNILDRDWRTRSLWNKMGFPNIGAEQVRKNLEGLSCKPGPVWVSLGKNRWTELEKSHHDFAFVAKTLNDVADVFVINISSPNTQGLRKLQGKEMLQPLIEEVKNVTNRPLLIKFSPDQTKEQFWEALDVALASGISGIIVTNTTLRRTRPAHSTFKNNDSFEKILKKWPATEGGISGGFLAPFSEEFLLWAQEYRVKCAQTFKIVSCGGIMTPEDVRNRLGMGADLVQVYSALVFEGFSFPKTVARWWHAQNQKIKK